MFVFEIVSLKDLDKFMIKLSFSCDFFLVKDFVRHYGKKYGNLSILGVDFLFCCRKLSFGIWKGDV